MRPIYNQIVEHVSACTQPHITSLLQQNMRSTLAERSFPEPRNEEPYRVPGACRVKALHEVCLRGTQACLLLDEDLPQPLLLLMLRHHCSRTGAGLTCRQAVGGGVLSVRIPCASQRTVGLATLLDLASSSSGRYDVRNWMSALQLRYPYEIGSLSTESHASSHTFATMLACPGARDDATV